MLSSVILSMAMSISPAPVADIHILDIQKIGRVRKGNRIHDANSLKIEVVGRVRKSNRI